MPAQTVARKPRRTKVDGKQYTGIYRSISGRLEIAYRLDGKLCWFTCPKGWNQTDALNKRNELSVQKEKGELQKPSTLTVAQAAAQWLAEYEDSGEWAPRTFDSRESFVRLHLIPAIGSVRLRDLNADHAWRVAHVMGEKGLRRSSRRDGLAKLSALCTWLVEDAKELRANPVEAIPKTRRKRISDDGAQGQPVKVITDMGAFLQAADTPFVLILKVALFTGLRLGEVLGLRLCDLGQDTIRVDGQLDRKTRQHTPRTKTPSSRRTVRDVPRGLITELRDSVSDGASDALLFVGPDGLGRWSQVVERAFDRAVKDAGLDESLSFHSTRHTCASRWIAEGRTVTHVQKQLGHKTPRITLDTYTHEFEAREQRDEARVASEAAYAALSTPEEREERPALRLVS